MLFKVALGSIGPTALRQVADTHNRERLEEAVAAQLQSLRDHLFKR